MLDDIVGELVREMIHKDFDFEDGILGFEGEIKKFPVDVDVFGRRRRRRRIGIGGRKERGVEENGEQGENGEEEEEGDIEGFSSVHPFFLNRGVCNCNCTHAGPCPCPCPCPLKYFSILIYTSI